MNRKELQLRTEKFHVDVIKLCPDFPKNAGGFETARQLIRAAGSVGANYRATARAKSNADFVYKIEVVLEEADESHYWLEVIKEAEIKTGAEVDRLINEANQLTAILLQQTKQPSQIKTNQTSKNHTSGILCIYKNETEY